MRIIHIVAIALTIAVVACWITIIVTPIDGDANRDGRVNAIDLTMMRRHIIGIYDLNWWQINRCDLNGNGRVDELDLGIVTDMILGR